MNTIRDIVFRGPSGIFSILLLAVFLTILPSLPLSAQGTWELIYDDLYGTLADIFFVDEFEGWVVDWSYSTTGYIYHTTDGGLSWELQPDPSSEGLFSVFFHSDSIGWAGGMGGVVLHTEDNGATWTVQDCGVSATVQDIFFLDDKEGWCVGGDVYPWQANPYFISYTTDGGETWEVQLDDTTSGPGIFECVSFANSDTGLVGGLDHKVYRTVNGGETWDFVVTDSLGVMNGVDYLGEGHFCGAGANANGGEAWHVVLKSDDYGSSWRTTSLDTIHEGRLQDISFADANYGICVGDIENLGYDGWSFFTIDGGETWQSLDPDAFSILFSVSYPKIFVAWTHMGVAGDIFRYTDINITPPEAVDDLQISIIAEDVRLNWSPISEDIFGNPILVGGYQIYRDVNPYFPVGPQFYLDFTSDTTFIDPNSVGSMLKYFYKVMSSR